MDAVDYLYKEWYKSTDKTAIDRLYAARIESVAAVRTDFEIHPKGSNRHFPLFYVPTNEMMLKLEAVQKK